MSAVWVDQVAAASASISATSGESIAATWGAFDAWYQLTEISPVAQEAASLSGFAQSSVASLYAEYVGQVTAMLRDQPRVDVPRLPAPEIRNGANLVAVHARVAEEYRRTYAFVEDEVAAQEAAIARAVDLMQADIMLASRRAQQDAMADLAVTEYRRVIRPELSRTGTCGLCIAASNQIYTVRELLPIHDRCWCETLPIVGSVDPGRTLNDDDLKALYADAGDSTTAADLKRTRYQVNEHGELGPVLTVKGQKFTGPDDLRNPPPAEQARRQLAALEPVLASLERRAAAGENVAGPLEYQRRLVAKLRSVVAAA